MPTSVLATLAIEASGLDRLRGCIGFYEVTLKSYMEDEERLIRLSWGVE